MCGRFTFTIDLQVLVDRFGAHPDPEVTHSFNASPSQFLPVILDIEPKRLQLVKWGLVPRWAKDPSIGNRMINARAETITEKPSFRSLIRSRRCMIPADGFYEWKSGPEGRRPWRIVPASGEPFAFAGLWDEWTPPEGSPLRTFTILTTAPNRFMSTYHHRMPVILDSREEAPWLNPDTALEDILSFLVPREDLALEAYPVSLRVNSPTNNDEDLLLPFSS